MTSPDHQKHVARRSPLALVLRTEGLAIGLAAILLFGQAHGSWSLFAVLILAPDLAMVGYLGGKRAGAICYNLAHSYVGPAMLCALNVVTEGPFLLQLALVWAAHIGLDRAVGYGLKYADGFKQTHLSRV